MHIPNIYATQTSRYNVSIAQRTGDETVSKPQEDFPPINVIWDEWWDTARAAQETGLTRLTVAIYCRDGKFRAKKIAREWRVDPDSVRSFQKSSSGRPLSDEN